MDAVKFLEEVKRMCDSYEECAACPANADGFNDCLVDNMHNIDAADAVSIIEKWSAAHPRKTRQSVFLEQYPDAVLDKFGVMQMCPNQTSDGGRRMKIIVDRGAYIPTRAHEADAGLDLYAPCGKTVPAKGSAVFDTGVHVQIPVGMVGFLKSKSGLNVKYGITSEGVIDSGFTGSIVAKLYNNSDEPYTVRMGDKITQLVILPIYAPELELVETFEETERGSSGFGSTGR